MDGISFVLFLNLYAAGNLYLQKANMQSVLSNSLFLWGIPTTHIQYSWSSGMGLRNHHCIY